MVGSARSLHCSTSVLHQTIGQRFYRKREVYDMLWNEGPEPVDLERNLAVGCPLSGPIAVTRDHNKIISVQSGPVRPPIRIFSSSGKLLFNMPWERKVSDGVMCVCVCVCVLCVCKLGSYAERNNYVSRWERIHCVVYCHFCYLYFIYCYYD